MQHSHISMPYYSNTTWNGIESYKYLTGCREEASLANMINLFLEHIRCSKSQNTYYCYSRDLHYLLEKLGDVKLTSITEETLQNFISKIMSKGIKKLVRSGTTLNRIKSVYRSFFSWCFKKTTLARIYRAKFTLQNLLQNTRLP